LQSPGPDLRGIHGQTYSDLAMLYDIGIYAKIGLCANILSRMRWGPAVSLPYRNDYA